MGWYEEYFLIDYEFEYTLRIVITPVDRFVEALGLDRAGTEGKLYTKGEYDALPEWDKFLDQQGETE